MALTITSAGQSHGLDKARLSILRTLNQLGSGHRITRAGDDAAGLAISEALRAQERGLAQGQRNLSDGISLTRTAEGALSEASDIVIRMRELSIQAGNGALDEAAKGAVQREFDELGEELTRITHATEFNSQKLLNGDLSGANAVKLRDGTGGDDVIQVSVGDHSAQALGVDGLDASDGSTLDALDAALSRISETRADLGATERRLTAGIRNLETAQENTAAANSRIRDADFASSTAELAKGQLLEQAAIAVQVQANISASAALRLLR